VKKATLITFTITQSQKTVLAEVLFGAVWLVLFFGDKKLGILLGFIFIFLRCSERSIGLLAQLFGW